MDILAQQKINQLEHDVQLLKTEVSRLAGELNRKINEDEVISQINISQENIRISGDKVTINGDTFIHDNVIKNAYIEKVSAEKFGRVYKDNAGTIVLDESATKGLYVSQKEED